MRIEIKKFREESVSLSAVIKDMRKRAMNIGEIADETNTRISDAA